MYFRKPRCTKIIFFFLLNFVVAVNLYSHCRTKNNTKQKGKRYDTINENVNDKCRTIETFGCREEKTCWTLKGVNSIKDVGLAS